MKPNLRTNFPRDFQRLPALVAALLLSLICSAGAAAPTLTTVNTINGQAEDNDTTISYTTLAAAANEADADGGVIQFRVETVSSGTLRKSATAVTPGSTLLAPGESWVWTPASNANGLLNAFTVRAWDGTSASAAAVQVQIQVAAVNDPPVISGTIVTSIDDTATEATASTGFLSGLTISDVEDSAVVVTVRVSKVAEDTLGDLVFPDASRTSSGNDYVYTFASASPATATTRLNAVSFMPIANRVAPGISSTFSVQVNVVESADSGSSAQSSATVTVVSVDDQPAVSLSFIPSTILDDGDSTPFRVVVTDPDIGEENESVTLTLTETAPAKGTLTIPAGSLTGTRTQLSAGMQTVKYRPSPVSGPATATFTCAVSGSNPVSSSTAILTITLSNDPPDISGINTGVIRTDDDPATPAVFPFQTVNINDLDTLQTLTATITLDNSAKGTITSAALTGTAAQLTVLVRQATFKPTANRVTVGQTETTTLTLSVTDGIASKSNSLTQVVTQSVNGAPAIILPPGTVQPRVIAGESSGSPFTGIVISDDDAVPQVTVTIRTDNASKGTFTTLNGFAELPAGSGILSFTGTPAAATTAVQGMVFTLNPSFSFPPGQPGLTTFTIEASDALQNRSTQVLSIVMRNAARNFLVTLREDDSRRRPGSLRQAVENAKDNDVITFAFAEYPAVLRLEPSLGPLLFTKHVRLKGPGADLLSISGDRDGNGTPDMQLGKVQANVSFEGLTLTQGTASTGGALHVGRNPSIPSNPPGSLTLSYCAVTDCRASQWGGAIDVEEGSLAMDHCLVKANATDPSFGLGGGALSLYTSASCSITASTFSGNRQRATAGFGGGAIYAENFNPQVIFPLAVTHCTFSGNEDASGKGTSIRSNVLNCRVSTRGSIFADAAQRNLHVAGSGQILSEGRNLSNDAARTTLIQGGVPQSVVLLNQTTDEVSTDPLLLPLARAIGGTDGYELSPSSPALGSSAAVEGTDQRGVIRGDGIPDSGAIESSARGRVIINEIQSRPAAGAFPFIEFYIPRDSGPLDMTGMSVWVNGKLRHTFATNSPPVLHPGFGVILAEGAVTPASASTPVVLTANPFWDGGDDPQRSTIELRSLGSPGVTFARANYVNVFVNPARLTQTFDNNSISLAPQFHGAAFVPNSVGQAPPQGPNMDRGGPASSPGADTGLTPFGQDNANPFASADKFVVNEDDLVTLPVLANDSDADGLDQLVLVDVSTTRSAPVDSPPVGNDATASSVLNSTVSITPAAAPLRGTQLWYDPRIAQRHLPIGISAADSFYYTIVDIGAGPITAYVPGGTATNITSPAHRLTTGEQITISGSQTAGYNAVFTVTRVDQNTFSIPFTFINNPATKGSWTTVGTRATTRRSENQVTLTVMGRNDAPTPVADTVATNEEQILRIMGDPDLIAAAPVFDTDPSYPQPRAYAATSLLVNDTDPDDDDNTFKKLRIVGVTQATVVTAYRGVAGQTPVTVTAASHGLTDGARVLISGYGGHASYNNYHTATVVDEDTFTIPIAFVENHAQKGLTGVLTPEGRLQTVSAMGAGVNLEIRASRLETNIVYNPRVSAELNQLSRNEPAADSFFYVIEDSHGANAFAKVTVNVTGVNDAPVPQDDPDSLGGLAELVTGGATLRDVLADAKVLYSVPDASAAGRAVVTLRAGESDYVLGGVPRTTEDTALEITAAAILGNDADVDHLDTLRITLAAGQEGSREGASVQLTGAGAGVVYDPSGSARLNSLAREEKIIDTIEITVWDGTIGVVSIVAIEVTGRNDVPEAQADEVTIPEDQLLTLAPPAVLFNDFEPDQDTNLPDNRKVLNPVTNAPTTVYGTRIDTSIAPAAGGINSFEAMAAFPALTRVNAPSHGLNTGEEIVIGGTAVDAYNGQFPVARLDENSFSIPVPSDAGAATAGAGTWASLRSTLTYNPRDSVFAGAPPNIVFTLDGLAQGQSYSDTWTYTMFDGSFVFANDDVFRVGADAIDVMLPVSVNDVNLNGLTGSLTIVAVGTPNQRGTATVAENNTILYTPETSFFGDEYFTYTVADEQGNVDSALVTVRVTIEQLNGNLQANGDAFTVAKGQSPLLRVLANDDIVPATGAVLTITRISTPPNAGGTAVIEGNAIRFTPDATAPTYPYSETFAYEISGGGTARAIATVAIQVANRENTLNLRADAVSVEAGSTNNQLTVLSNDNILPGSSLALTITAAGTPVPPTVAHGSVAISADGKRLLYTPDDGFVGTDRFRYTASDGLGGTGTTEVSVTVGGLTANNDFFTVSSTAPVSPVTLDVLANDRILGAPGVVSIKPMAAINDSLGVLSVSGDRQSLVFTAVAGATGEKTFAYRIVDSTGSEAAGSVTVFVFTSGLRANSDFFSVQAGSNSSELHVLLNDASIPDLGQQKAIASIGTGSDAPDEGGTVLINAANNRLLYTPADGFSGEERFTYFVTDGDSTATAQVVVRVSDGTLFASDDWFSVYKGSSPMRLEVLANDRVLPPSGQQLTITGVGIIQNAPGMQGTVTVTGDGGALLYTPNEANTTYPYTESFTYEISDGSVRRAHGTVRVEVLDRIGAREMETNDDAFTVLTGSQNTLLGVLANDDIRPAAATGWTITVAGDPDQGGSAVVTGPAIAYTPRTGFVGTEIFSYSVSDGLGGTGAATVTVKVGDISVSDDNFTVLSGSGSTALEVLANDGLFPAGFPNPDDRPGLTGFTLSTAPITPDRGGTAIVSGDQILYQPAAGFAGEESFAYQVKDDSGVTFPGKVTVNVEPDGTDRDSAVLTINVTGVNDLPVFTNFSITATDDQTSVHPFPDAIVSDVDNQRTERLTVRVSWPAANGTMTGGFTEISPGLIEFTGEPVEVTAALRGLIFTPFQNLIPVGTTAPTEFGLTIDDGFVSSPVVVTGNRTVITPVNDLPVITGTVARQPLWFRATLKPFIGVNITDVDDLGQQRLQVSIRIDVAERGFLSGSGGFAEQPAGSGNYVFSGTPAAASAAIRELVFQPTPANRVTPSHPETSRFTISVNDGFSPPVVDSTTTVVVVHSQNQLGRLPLPGDGEDPVPSTFAYGTSTAISGNTLVIGSPLRDLPAADAGQVFVYERGDTFGVPWRRVAALNAADARAGDHFGEAVAIAGDLLVVGAPFSDAAGGLSNVGAVYVFQRSPANRNNWIPLKKLTPPTTNPAGADQFGASVAIFGTTVFAGSPRSDRQGETAVGKAYVFEQNQGGASNFGLTQTLSAGDGRGADIFGNAVALDSNTAVIGAAGASRTRNSQGWEFGAAYVFERPAAGGSWTEKRKLHNFGDPESRTYDHFGFSVDIDRDTIIVGAVDFDPMVNTVRRTDGGAVFIFDRPAGGGDWILTTKLASPDTAAAENYGFAVSLAGDLCLIGAPKDNPNANPNGYVDVRRRDGEGASLWDPVDRLIPDSSTTIDRFGQSVALDQATGSAGLIVDTANAGSTIVYQFLYDLGPRRAINLTDQLASENQVFTFAVPAGTFGDPVYGEDLSLSATLYDGSPLPAGGWLSFNPSTGTFSGTPAPTNNADYLVVVIATNPLGTGVTSNAFSIDVALDPARALQRAYTEWSAGHFPAEILANPALEATVWGPHANADGDDSTNLLEMLFGTQLWTRESPPVRFVQSPGSPISVTFPQADMKAAEFLRVEWSGDMAGWSRQNVGYNIRTDGQGNQWVTATVYPDAPRSSMFIRIVGAP